MKTPIQLLLRFIFTLFVLSLLALQACTGNRFNESAPFTVLADQYRDFPRAEQTRKRIADMGLDAYIVQYSVPQEGKWYGVFVSASPTLEGMMAQKIDFEDNYGFQEANIENYNKLKKYIVEIAPDAPAQEQIIRDNPSVTPLLATMLEMVPYNSAYQLKKLLILNLKDAAHASVAALAARNYEIDLPRGVSPLTIMQYANGMADAFYEDDLQGHDMKVCVAALKEKHPFGDSVAAYFAKAILNTRSYNKERVFVEVEGGVDLFGYRITLSPNYETTKHYVILTDEDQRYLFFLQSDAAGTDKMFRFAERIGAGRGITQYTYPDELVQTLPAVQDSANHLIVLQIQHIGSADGRHARKYIGGLRSKLLFYHDVKGLWSFQSSAFFDQENTQFIYENGYIPNRADTLQLHGTTAYLSVQNKVIPGIAGTNVTAKEIVFSKNGVIYQFANQPGGTLTKGELLQYARQFQLSTPPEKDYFWYRWFDF